MEANSWRQAQGQQSASTGEAAPAGDWRTQIQQEARTRIVNKITDNLKRRLPHSPLPDGLSELQRIAIQFEEKVYNSSTSQSDYLRKISLKMLSMESKTSYPAKVNSSISNSGFSNHNPAEPVPLGMPSQVNQGQSLHNSMINQAPAGQQIVQENISSTVQRSSISSSLLTNAGLNQSMITGVGQASSLQNMSGISHNSVSGNSSIGQSVTPETYASLQRQTQGRQQAQQIMPQQQTQSRNQFVQQQVHHQLSKQKLQQSSLLQQQPQQQSILQSTQLQSSQQPLVQMASSLQSAQPSITQTQSGVMQSAGHSIHQKNQLNSVQQPAQTLLLQHPQSDGRQQQQVQSAMHLQIPSLQQQPTSITQQSSLPSQQHNQQLIGSQAMSNTLQGQFLGQQTGIAIMQQLPQRMEVQQNNLRQQSQQTISLHQQQQLGAQSNISGPQQQQQQQQQSPMHMLQKSKRTLHQQTQMQLQQQNQLTSMLAMQSQGQQLQNQPPQQQLKSQFHSQTAQLQTLATVQHPNALHQETQQRVHSSGTLLPQGATEQQKQNFQSQRGLSDVSSTLVDSKAQTENLAAVDWQEEIYQKIKTMKELYFAELNELFQRISMKLQQYDASPPLVKQAETYEKAKGYKLLLESKLHLLQLSKDNIQPGLKDKIYLHEKHIISLLSSQRKKPPGIHQLQHSGGNTRSLPQQEPSQVPKLQQPDNSINQVQHMNMQSSSTLMQPAAIPTSQLGSVPLSSQFGLPNSQKNLTNTVQPTGKMDQVQGNSFNSLQQGAMGSRQQSGAVSGQNTMTVAQQTNANSLSQSSTSTLQNSASSIHLSPNTHQQLVMQQQHQMQEQRQHIIQNQQMNQLQQRNLQQRLNQQQKQQLQNQQPLQQQLQPQQKQQQAAQLPTNQLAQVHQPTESNDLKLRQGTMVKSGPYQQNYSGSQSQYLYQQFKQGASFPMSSSQNLPSSSPQIYHHPSPQVDQLNLLSSQSISVTPLQSSTSPFAPSPSTLLVPSPIPVDSETPISRITPLPNTGHAGNQQSSHALPQVQSIAVSTPGMSASPLLEFAGPDGNLSKMPTTISSRTSAAERPLDRLLRLVQSSSPKILSSAVYDIGSVVSMTDRISGSAPGKGSRTAVGEDLVAMTKCRLQAKSLISQDGSANTKKMKRDISAMPLTNFSSAESLNESFKMAYDLEASESESSATSHVKRQKTEVNYDLLEEIREINQQLIDTLVSISEDESYSMIGASEGEGTIIKCSFMAVALSPGLKRQFASEQLGPIVPLKLFVPATYPKSSPILLDKLPDKPSKESDDLSTKARSRFNSALRSLSQPMSVGEMARIWDACTRKVITEYAQQKGGGTFSSNYSTWESCVSA